MSQISPSDQSVILNKLTSVRREMATLSAAILTLETAVRTNDQTLLTRQLQLDPLSGVTKAMQDSYTTIARITNIRVNANTVAGGSAAGASAGT